jgi:hypothetical protein
MTKGRLSMTATHYILVEGEIHDAGRPERTWRYLARRDWVEQDDGRVTLGRAQRVSVFVRDAEARARLSLLAERYAAEHPGRALLPKDSPLLPAA